MATVQGACRLSVITGSLAIYPQFIAPGAERVAVLGAHGFLSCVGRRCLAWDGAALRGAVRSDGGGTHPGTCRPRPGARKHKLSKRPATWPLCSSGLLHRDGLGLGLGHGDGEDALVVGDAHLALDAVVAHGQCRLSYGVDFPTFAKIDVNGEVADPPYTWLKAQKGGLVGRDIHWSFTKFLVNRKGEAVACFAPATTPEKIEAHVAELL